MTWKYFPVQNLVSLSPFYRWQNCELKLATRPRSCNQRMELLRGSTGIWYLNTLWDLVPSYRSIYVLHCSPSNLLSKLQLHCPSFNPWTHHAHSHLMTFPLYVDFFLISSGFSSSRLLDSKRAHSVVQPSWRVWPSFNGWAQHSAGNWHWENGEKSQLHVLN